MPHKKFFWRALSVLFLLGGLLFLPWVLVFAAGFFFSAFFFWYLEIFLAIFAVSLLADIALWKLFLVAVPVILAQENFRANLNFTKPLPAALWLWGAGLLTFLAAFFVVI